MRVIWKAAIWRSSGLAVALAFLLSGSPPVRLSAQDYRAQALRILKTVPLIDGHNDLADAIRARGGLDSVDVAVLQPKLMSDIPKLRAGGVGAQFWAAYVPVTTIDSGPHPAVYALEQIDLIKRLCAKYPRDLAMARTAADVERNFAAGKISCLIGMVNFDPGFGSEAVRLYDDSMEARIRSLRAAGVDPATVADSTKAWAARAPKATLAQVADHIEHIRDVAGVDAVGLGSDFDGITEVPVGLEDVSKFRDLIAELLRRGWSEQDVKKVAGLNALRVLRTGEQVAAGRSVR